MYLSSHVWHVRWSSTKIKLQKTWSVQYRTRHDVVSDAFQAISLPSSHCLQVLLGWWRSHTTTPKRHTRHHPAADQSSSHRSWSLTASINCFTWSRTTSTQHFSGTWLSHSTSSFTPTSLLNRRRHCSTAHHVADDILVQRSRHPAAPSFMSHAT